MSFTNLIRIIYDFGFITTYFFNLALIYLTFYGFKRSIEPFQRVILYLAVSGILIAAFEFLAPPVLHGYNSGFALFSVGEIAYVPAELSSIFLYINSGTYAVTLSNLTLQFIYRYFAVIKPSMLTSFMSWKIILWFCYPLFFGSVSILSGYFFLSPDDFSTNYLRDGIKELYDVDLKDVPNLASVAFNYTDPAQPIHWKNCYHTVTMVVIISIQYVTMIYCGKSMHSDLAKKAAWSSPPIRKYHRGFYNVLMSQVLMLTLLLVTPLYIIIVSPWLKLEGNPPLGIASSMLCFYPSIHAIFMFFFVPKYFNLIMDLMTEARTRTVVWATSVPHICNDACSRHSASKFVDTS